MAKICYHIPRFSRQLVKPEDFNPLRASRNAASLGEIVLWSEEQQLPKYASEADIEERWEKHLRESHGG